MRALASAVRIGKRRRIDGAQPRQLEESRTASRNIVERDHRGELRPSEHRRHDPW